MKIKIIEYTDPEDKRFGTRDVCYQSGTVRSTVTKDGYTEATCLIAGTSGREDLLLLRAKILIELEI